jgi:hypothetical protein
MFLKEFNFKSNILYNETHLMVSMNKALFIVGFLAIVFAGAFMISTSAVQADEKCPNKSSGNTASNANPIISTSLNAPSSSQLAPGQTA